MENVSVKEKLLKNFQGRRGVYLIIITAILTFLLVSYYVAVFSFHRNMFQQFNQAVLQEEEADLVLESACREDDSLDSLYHTFAFEKALLAIAQTDSAGLVINLPDSAMYLQIRGVKVFDTKLRQAQLDRFAGEMGINAYNKYFAKPAKLTRDTCNYEKEPIIHIDAPEDTTEAKNIKHEPDTAITNPVRITYWLDNNLVVNIDGIKPDKDGFWATSMNYIADRLAMVHRFTVAYFTGTKEQYIPELTVEVDNKDALIIYRALHARAPVVVYF